MAAEEYYFSIKGPVQAESVVKGSRFIAQAGPVEFRKSAEEFVSQISVRFKDATHNCFAYKIGLGDAAAFRFNDAGEPSGTAGRPILQAIESKNITNVVVVVTRYFGGTKLGTGGLIRAYSGVTLAALDAATMVKCYPKIRMILRFDYELSNTIHQVLNKVHAEILQSDFQPKTTYEVQLRASAEKDVRSQLIDMTAGRISIEKSPQAVDPFLAQ